MREPAATSATRHRPAPGPPRPARARPQHRAAWPVALTSLIAEGSTKAEPNQAGSTTTSPGSSGVSYPVGSEPPTAVHLFPDADEPGDALLTTDVR